MVQNLVAVVLNEFNNSYLFFLKDFNFSELLGDIKYDELGRIVG